MHLSLPRLSAPFPPNQKVFQALPGFPLHALQPGNPLTLMSWDNYKIPHYVTWLLGITALHSLMFMFLKTNTFCLLLQLFGLGRIYLMSCYSILIENNSLKTYLNTQNMLNLYSIRNFLIRNNHNIKSSQRNNDMVKF